MATTSNPNLCIGLADVLAARERLRGAIYESPCPHSIMLSALTGQQVYLKLENLQMTGSFKERGALNRIALLTPEQAARGVIAASAGNHAQGVAYHATKRGIRALIVMPLTTALVKVTATRNFGAEVLLHGANYDEACAEAVRLCDEQHFTFIHPFDDPAVMAGQGVIGLELLEQVPQLEAVVVPIGGGGLIGGVACAIKEAASGLAPGPRGRRADLAASVDAGRHRGAPSGHGRSGHNHRGRHRGAARGRPHISPGRALRRRDRHRGGGRDRLRDPDAAGAREDAGRGRRRRRAGRAARAPHQPARSAHRGAGRRRQHRRHAALQRSSSAAW